MVSMRERITELEIRRNDIADKEYLTDDEVLMLQQIMLVIEQLKEKLL